ncbi:Cyclic di-GMP phosphodiesterase PdeB [Polaromonas vacuolata]|uniref:Cyclic di-GMP phosphodiesterase PdeB n=1 Tax=Polaromonas vacuolata TaxID=37448 RepID=A0A6H2HCR4_9BURK|nr:EAL domain-containing protein [Polaromonas vacuolata]QJC57384.1 Cyclic di-GMP phosphodiesterase PdeB [Polaromonas vacuolata]
MKKLFECLLEAIATQLFPALLVIATITILLTQAIETKKFPTILPIQAVEQANPRQSINHQDMLEKLKLIAPKQVVRTQLSTNPFWFSLAVIASESNQDYSVLFNSRHAMALTCWDQKTNVLFGNADRSSTSGMIEVSGAGFALKVPRAKNTELLCRGLFRGPAKISAELLSPTALEANDITHNRTGSLIEAGIGVLAISMLLTAIVNRSRLYWAFVGWLLINMRMAALSAGTDFTFFGWRLPPSVLVLDRQWTICMYFAMTAALFLLLFKDELKELKTGWLLTSTQVAAVVFIVVCPFITYEQIILSLWITSPLGVAIIIYYLIKVIRKFKSRMALWYAASIFVTVLATLNEVFAAAAGQFFSGVAIHGFNSVTAALVSALLATAAVAEHIRSDKISKEASYADSPVGLFTVHRDGHIIKSNPAFNELLGEFDDKRRKHLTAYFDDRVVQQIMTLKDATTHVSIEIETKHANKITGNDRWFNVGVSAVDGRLIECSLQDVTYRVLAAERIEYAASHDLLTGCLNLRGIGMAMEKHEIQPASLAYFDLDRFKLINDLYGHNAGDIVLNQVCSRIKTLIGPDELLVRVGGDEFVIVFLSDKIEISASFCEKLIHIISSEPYKIESQSFTLAISGGLVGTERFTNAPLKEIISAADTLCRMAKKRPNEQLVIMRSNDEFFTHHKDSLELITCLQNSQTPEGLYLVMQPEMSLIAPFDSLNFEVLIRMKKPDGGIVPAAVIIEAAEAHGKTAIIDMWVLSTTIAWIEKNHALLTNTRFIGINLSGGSLNDNSFNEELFKLLGKHPLALKKIFLEITESVALTDMANMQKFISRVRQIGAKVGLDDFGAGYSSFGYLRGLSVDALKLDGSLVKGASDNAAGMAIVESIASLVSGLGMKSIGEFAENLAIIKVLVRAGVDYAQGYGISKPVMPEQILLANSSADFITDPATLEYVKSLQASTEKTKELATDIFDFVPGGRLH